MHAETIETLTGDIRFLRALVILHGTDTQTAVARRTLLAASRYKIQRVSHQTIGRCEIHAAVSLRSQLINECFQHVEFGRRVASLMLVLRSLELRIQRVNNSSVLDHS